MALDDATVVSRAELAEGEEKSDQGLTEEQRSQLSTALLEYEPWMDRLDHLIVDRDEMILRRIIDDDLFYDECYKSYMKYADSQLLNLAREYVPAQEVNEILEGEEGFGSVKTRVGAAVSVLGSIRPAG